MTSGGTPDQSQAAGLFAAYVAESSAVHVLATDKLGRIRACNRAMLECLSGTSSQIHGTPLWRYLQEPDAARVLERLLAGPGLPGTRMLLHFAGAVSGGATLACSVEVLTEGLLIVGDAFCAHAVRQHGGDDRLTGPSPCLTLADDHGNGNEDASPRERPFSLLADLSSDCLFSAAPDSTFLYLSPACLPLLGYTPDEMAGHRAYEYFHPDDETAHAAAHQTIFTSSDVAAIAHRMRRKDGSYIWLETRLHAHRDAATGEVLDQYGIMRDISERKQADNALRASEAQFRTLIETSPVAMVLVDASGQIEAVNDATHTLLGYEQDHLIGQPVAMLYPEDVRLEVMQRHRDFFATGRPLRGFYDILQASGSSITVLATSAQVTSPNGRLKRATFLMDVTEHERMSAALRASETRLRTVITYAPVVLFALDCAGVFTFFEGGILAAYGISPGPMVGISAAEWLQTWPDLAELCRKGLVGEPLATTIEVHDKTLDVWWTPEFDADGVPHGGTGLIVDVSDATYARRDAERACAEAVELARLRSDFVATVSHDLRSPLTSIIGYGELLQARWMDLDDTQRQERLGRMVLATHRQHRLVEDLLALTRLEAGVPGPRAMPVDLPPLIRRVSVEASGAHPGQRIDLGGPGELHVLGDPDRIMQVLANMLDNAVKYSPVGSLVIVTWGADGGSAFIRVRDRGSGVPAEYRARLFTRFGRIPGSQARPGQISTGLGLHLAREYARLMGGDLELERTGAEGSVFCLRLLLPSVNAGGQ